MLQGRYEPALVLISVLVAVLASYTALALAERVNRAGGTAARWWIAGGGFAMGAGIWSMHFIGMLAFRLPIPLGYDLGLTLVSWALPVAVSGLALSQASLANPTLRHLAVSAVLMGVGINAMHYVGMAAMRMEPGIQWNGLLVLASLLIAVCAAAAALWIAFSLRRRSGGWRARSVAAAFMGLAVVGMHYTGMAAASFPEGSVCLAASSSFSLTGLSLLVIVATVAVLAIALLTSVFDARLEARNEILRVTREASEERQLMLQRERSARVEMERINTLKDQFLATLSHELRTPLNAILGWVQLLQVKKDEASVHKGLQTIERNARLQARLIEDLLDMSRIVAGKVRLEATWVDVGPVIGAAVEAARPSAFARGLSLESGVAPGLPLVWGDPARLHQVMWNLLANSIKFTPEGGRIRVEVCLEGERLCARVSDTGEGIAQEFLPHVFDRFRQADAGEARRHGGLGLGLSIVRQLVELHGGTVEAQSAGPGRGATFTVWLPTRTAKAPAISEGRPELPEAAPFSPRRLDGIRALLVEDDQDARHLAEQILRECGMAVQSVDSGPAALQAIDRQAPDVLISDIGMPGMDGFELIARIRRDPRPAIAGLPAIALTAFTRAEDRERALRQGFDRFLRKPVDATELVSEIAALAG
ncbi:response regulator [Ramlibacter henchirensis]|uniref:Virulence sensor protein BvgS n=1 Tax=Ramlibacter henchirensis TaxID=204072 RepID=A0A4Z0C3V7_9BURK|nr:MHYT domain-containing protein [Ramlibacter henchirensis]TFZ06266.1 response regulator [Ramlibacter henchirensis]